MAQAQKHFMIHKGKGHKITVPAETREELDPKTGKTVTIVTKKAHQVTVDLAPGTSFGNYPIGRPIEVPDPETRKRLAARGFVDFGTGKKAEEKVDKLTGAADQRAIEEEQAEVGKMNEAKSDPALASTLEGEGGK